MRKNTAKLDTFTKLITFNFNGEEFTVDLKEGDLDDSWNCITTKDGTQYDVNFSWEDSRWCPEPAFSVYPLTDNGDGTWSTDWSNSTSINIKEILGGPNQYHNDEPQVYNPDYLPHRFEVFNAEGVLQFKTKSFIRASDSTSQVFPKEETKGWYFESIDTHGGRLRIN